MMFAIRCAGDVIGHSEFEHEDLSMAIVFGAFRPTAAWPPPGHSIPRP